MKYIAKNLYWYNYFVLLILISSGCSMNVSNLQKIHASYPKVSDSADTVYQLNSNKQRTHFFVDGREIAVGRRVKIVIDEYEHTIVAQPEGCISKEEFIQPPYNSHSPLSFTFLLGECSDNINTKVKTVVKTPPQTGVSTPPIIIVNIFNNNFRGGTLETTKKKVKVEAEVYDPDGISAVIINGELITVNEKQKYVKNIFLNPGINKVDISAYDQNNTKTKRTIFINKKSNRIDSLQKEVNKSSANVRRSALIIGNSNYAFFSNLKNPINDAEDMTHALSKLGFAVNTLLDANQEQIEGAISDFGRKLTKGGAGLFYYAGHGVQVSGKNYLIPVDVDIKREKDVRYKAVDVGQVLDEMGYARNELNIVILDACRNNPLPSSFRSSSRGLARVDSPKGTLVAFATSPGSTALDGEGRNGTYTKHLLKNIQIPNITIEEVFKKVLQGINKETEGLQTPWISSSFTGDFYFNKE